MPSQKPGSNGYGAMDSYKRNNGMGANEKGKSTKKDGNNVSDSLKNAKKKQTKKATREVLRNAATAFNPVVGKAVDVALKTKAGDKLLDEFAEAKTPAEGMIKVANKIKKDAIKKKIIMTAGPIILVLFLLIVIIPVIFKNADSQIYGNENGGDVEKISKDDSDGLDDEKITDIFADYPQLYETINKATYEYSNDYGVDIDRLLVISTLVAPLENGFFSPYPCNENDEDGKQCTMYQGEEVEWEDFLVTWGYNSYLLSAMQMMTYVDYDYKGLNKFNRQFCNPRPGTMQEIAQNDMEDNSCWGKSLFNSRATDISFLECLFRGRTYEVQAKQAASNELNITCTKGTKIDAKDNDEKYPIVKVLSTDEADYEIVNKDPGTRSNDGTSTSSSSSNLEVIEKKDTGGVYFWNLVNEDGFIYNHLTKYEDVDNDKESSSTVLSYEDSKVNTYELAGYIYDYYYSIRKDCRSIEIVPKPTETTASNVEYDENVENQVFNSLKKYYDPSYNSKYAMEYYKALSIIIRSNILNGEIVPDADKIGELDENLGLAKSEDEESIDKNIKFNDLINLIQSSYGTKGIVITEKDKQSVNDNTKRLIKKVEIDEFCPQTYIPVNKKVKGDIEKNIELDGSFFLDELQRELPVRSKDIRDYTGTYNEDLGYGKEGIDCPCFKLPENRPFVTGNNVLEDDSNSIRTCDGLSAALDTPYLYNITTKRNNFGNAIMPFQKARGKCFKVDMCENQISSYFATLQYTPGRTDYNESKTSRGVSTIAMRYYADQGYNWRGILRLFLDRTKDYDGFEYHVTFKRIDKSLQEGECQNHGYTKELITTKTEKCNIFNSCKMQKTGEYFKKW